MKNKYWIIIVTVSGLICAFLYSQRNPLAKYGVFYRVEHGDHYEVNMVDFWLQTDKCKVEGLSFTADNATVDFRRAGGDPIPEIVVKSSTGHYGVARLILKDGKPVGFHIVETSIGVSYPPEGYYCP